MSETTEPNIEVSASDRRLARALLLVAPPVLSIAVLAAAYFGSTRPDFPGAVISLVAWPAVIALGLIAVIGVVGGALRFWRGSVDRQVVYPRWVIVIYLLKVTLLLTVVLLAIVALLSLLVGGRVQEVAVSAVTLALVVSACLIVMTALPTELWRLCAARGGPR